MKPAPFAYVRAEDIGHAIALWQQSGPDARLIAGGQSLVASLNLRLADVPVLIDISRIDALKGITITSTGLRLGALVTHGEIERSALVAAHAPAMHEAAPLIAHPAIRSRGTIGGSLAYADPAAEWPAVMVALGATIITHGPKGERRVPAEAFFLGLFETALQDFEMIVAVDVPALLPVNVRLSASLPVVVGITRWSACVVGQLPTRPGSSPARGWSISAPGIARSWPGLRWRRWMAAPGSKPPRRHSTRISTRPMTSRPQAR